VYLYFKASRAILGPTQPPTQWKTRDVLLGIQRSGHGPDHSPQFSAEFKNDWSYRAHVFQRNKFKINFYTIVKDSKTIHFCAKVEGKVLKKSCWYLTQYLRLSLTNIVRRYVVFLELEVGTSRLVKQGKWNCRGWPLASAAVPVVRVTATTADGCV
jgi:hypothetical protein